MFFNNSLITVDPISPLTLSNCFMSCLIDSHMLKCYLVWEMVAESSPVLAPPITIWQLAAGDPAFQVKQSP